jgi:hypothetical protein
MKKRKQKKEESYRKRFFGKDNLLLRSASRIIKGLEGTNEERLGQFEMIEQTPQFREEYPDELKRKDISFLVKVQLGKY